MAIAIDKGWCVKMVSNHWRRYGDPKFGGIINCEFADKNKRGRLDADAAKAVITAAIGVQVPTTLWNQITNTNGVNRVIFIILFSFEIIGYQLIIVQCKGLDIIWVTRCQVSGLPTPLVIWTDHFQDQHYLDKNKCMSEIVRHHRQKNGQTDWKWFLESHTVDVV